MRSVLLLLLIVTVLSANSSHHLANYFFISDPENSAVAEAGVAQVSTLGSIRINPANGAIYARKSGVELAFDIGWNGLPTNNILNQSLSNSPISIDGKSFRIAYFPSMKNEVFNWGVIFSFNSDKIVMEDLIYTLSYPIMGTTELGTGSYTSSVAQTVTTFTFSWLDIFSFGLAMDISSYADIIKIQYNPVLLDSGETESDRFRDRENQVDLNLGLGIQYQFPISDKFHIEPALGVSMLQIGKDSLSEYFFDLNDNKLTIPTSFHLGGRLSFGYKDYLLFTSLFDRHFNHIEENAYTDSYGWEIGGCASIKCL